MIVVDQQYTSLVSGHCKLPMVFVRYRLFDRCECLELALGIGQLLAQPPIFRLDGLQALIDCLFLGSGLA